MKLPFVAKAGLMATGRCNETGARRAFVILCDLSVTSLGSFISLNVFSTSWPSAVNLSAKLLGSGKIIIVASYL